MMYLYYTKLSRYGLCGRYTAIVNLEAIKKLTTEKKRAIIEAIEEEKSAFEDNPGETEEELRIHDERIEHHRQNPGKAISWKGLKKQLLNQNR